MSIRQENVGKNFKHVTVSWDNPLRSFGELSRVEVRLTRQPVTNETALEDVIEKIGLDLMVSLFRGIL